MKIRFTGLFIIAGLFMLSACGQKGPLYLEKKPAPAAVATESEQDAVVDKTEEKADKQ